MNCCCDALDNCFNIVNNCYYCCNVNNCCSSLGKLVDNVCCCTCCYVCLTDSDARTVNRIAAAGFTALGIVAISLSSTCVTEAKTDLIMSIFGTAACAGYFFAYINANKMHGCEEGTICQACFQFISMALLTSSVVLSILKFDRCNAS